MLDSLSVLKKARELGSTKSLADVEAEIAKIDYPALRAQERDNYRVEIWDKVTPINGIEPSVILQDAPEGGEIYLIYIGNRLMYLQKHDPDQMGFAPMTRERALEAAGKIVDDLIEQAVDARVEKEVLRNLLI